MNKIKIINFNAIYIMGKGDFLLHFYNILKNFTNRVYLVKKKTKFNDRDIIFSINNKYIFSKKTLKKGIFINYHDSLTSSYRGLYGSSLAILKNDKFFGCTFHLIDTGIDTGPVIYKKEFKIFKNYSSSYIDKLSLYHGFKLFKKIIYDIFIKKKIKTYLVKKKGQYYPLKKIYKIVNYGFIDINWKIEKIMRHYYALNVSKFKKNLIFKPKILDCNNHIFEILSLKKINFKLNCFKSNNYYLVNNQIYVYKNPYTLIIKINKHLNKIKFAKSSQINKYIKNQNFLKNR